MKDLGGINSQVVLPNPYNPSFNVAAWSAENSLPVVQQTSEGKNEINVSTLMNVLFFFFLMNKANVFIFTHINIRF